MSTNQGDKEHPEAENKPSTQSKRRRLLLKEDVILADKILGGWILAVTVLAGFLYAGHYATALALFGASLVAIVATIFLHIRHVRHRKRTIAWAVLAPLILAHVGLLIWAVTLRGSEPAPFHIEATVALVTPPPTDERMTAFVLLEPSKGGPILRPVERIQYLYISNKSNRKRTVLKYELALSNGDGWHGFFQTWTKLCRIAIIGARLFVPTNITIDRLDAKEIDLVNFFDRVPLEQPMAPGESESGWTLWVCPPGAQAVCETGKKQLRVRLYDSEGVTSEYIIPDNPVADMLSTDLKVMPGTIDLGTVPWSPSTLCD